MVIYFFKSHNNFMNKLFTLLKNTFYPNNEEYYDFTLPENEIENSENTETNSSENILTKTNKTPSETNSSNIKIDGINSEKDPKNVFPSLSINLDFLKVKYNTLINSDISIREFTLNARNKQYNAFLIYIDGMVDTKIINDFVLEPLMLKNKANSYDGNEVKVVSEADF